MKGRLLIVEDDPEMRRVTRGLFERAGFRTTAVENAEGALAEMVQAVPDLVLIDIQLPGLSGVKLLEILRGDPRTAALPVILVTALRRGPEKVLGLQTGADDYVTKPYDPNELLARVEAVLRRAGKSSPPSEALGCHGLRVDLARRTVTVNDQAIVLRRKEYELLVSFLKHPGQLMSRDRLARALWNDETIVTDNTLSTHIQRLREKLGPFGRRIQTLVGEGYRFEDGELPPT